MGACKATTEKSHAISRASSSASVDSRAASDGVVNGSAERKLMGLKTEASIPSKRKLQTPMPCPKRVEAGSSSAEKATSFTARPKRFISFELPDHLPTDEEIRQQVAQAKMEKSHAAVTSAPSSSAVGPNVGGSSSSADKATSVTARPGRFVTYELPDDLPTDEEIRQQATCMKMELCLLMKRDAELMSRVNLKRMNDVKIKLERSGQQNSEAYRYAEIMIPRLEELLAAARSLPWSYFGFVTSNSGDKETPGEGPPKNEVKTAAKYNTRKLKTGKQVTETSVVVAKKNPSSRK